MSDNFNAKYDEYLNIFNTAFGEFFGKIDTKPQILGESMKYSAMLGGKRVRPVLMFAVGEILGVDIKKLVPFAIALELIHTYSLIHDDLPEMDNDDYRRGKPSNHKVYGAANALLAGDGLLNTAYSVLLDECFKGNEYVSAAKFICESAGINGMIAGQSADLLYENAEKVEKETLEYIYENKTAKLIIAALVVPTILLNGQFYPEMKLLGQKLGYLFQLTDDILDACGDFEKVGKTLGKDEKEGKSTSVKLYGLDGCRLQADFICDDCHRLLDCIPKEVDFLHCFVDFVKSRVS